MKPLNTTYEKIITLLMGLYYHVQKSSRQKKSLQASYGVFGMPNLLPKRVGGTRWLGHIVAAYAFLKTYKAVVAHLLTASNDKTICSAKAEGLAKLATNTQVIVGILTLNVDTFATI